MSEVKLTYNGKEYIYNDTDNFIKVAADFQNEFDNEIVLVNKNNKLKELWKTVKADGEISFITLADSIGMKTYRRSLTLMTVKAVFDAMGHENTKSVRLLFSVKDGYYFEAEGDFKVDSDFIAKVTERMNEMVAMKMEITKNALDIDDAIKDCETYGMYDKEKLFKYRNHSKVNMYFMNNFEDYYYGSMVPHAGYLKWFNLVLYDKGFILQFPNLSNPHKIQPLDIEKKLYSTRRESVEWADMLGIRTVGDLNEAVINGEINDLILVQEALQEKKIGDIAHDIANRKTAKFVLIAGPSSSSKTSFSHRLSIQLRTLGLKPHPIACDNYFVDREQTPKDADGKYDFECLEAMDIDLLNNQLEELLEGKEVKLPTYNFELGKKEYLGNTLKLNEDDILVIEGIHCLDDKLTYKLDDNSKYKIYVSALAQINIDEHNRFPSTDGRLVRRMVRDARTRGTSPVNTIRQWPSVRRGEEKYIFPFQESADVIFNTASIYELAVLKPYCEPLLYSVPKDCPEYLEAKRLRKMFDYFVGVRADNIPNNSLLKEFIGGSVFPVG